MRLAIALPFEAPLSARRLIAHRLAGLQHAHDPFLRLLRAEQLDERAPLELQQPFLIDQAARFDVPTAHRFRDAAGDQEIMLADETAVAHVDERRLDGRYRRAARD